MKNKILAVLLAFLPIAIGFSCETLIVDNLRPELLQTGSDWTLGLQDYGWLLGILGVLMLIVWCGATFFLTPKSGKLWLSFWIINSLGFASLAIVMFSILTYSLPANILGYLADMYTLPLFTWGGIIQSLISFLSGANTVHYGLYQMFSALLLIAASYLGVRLRIRQK